MHRTRALVNTVISALHYRNGGNLVINSGFPSRFLAIAASVDAPGHSTETSGIFSVFKNYVIF